MGDALKLLSDPRVMFWISAAVQMVRRHAAEHDGEVLTDEQVHAKLLEEAADGQSAIAEEFRLRGWDLPE